MLCTLQKILAAAGKADVLGSLEENDPNADEEGDDVDVDDVADLLASTL